MKKESTRDHIDLLMSCKYWPLVYAVDMACDVVAHMEAREPSYAKALWDDRRGCFQKPHKRKSPEVCQFNCYILNHCNNFCL